MDIEVWLRGIGLAQYADTFRANDIDGDLLRQLTTDDLKDIGVTSLGHRKRLLEAIAALGAMAEAGIPQKASEAPNGPRETGERRQVTVMFSDLVGSTALSARLDPEDLRELISAYQKCVAEAVIRLGGYVAKYLGDGVLVYFGYPQAFEDGAERAVLAALEVISAVAALHASETLQTRVGIATGTVVVGDLVGAGEAQERGIIGETPNLAARLQSVAEPNQAVIADDTKRLLGNLFEFQDLGTQTLKGITEPVRAWAVLRTGVAEGRFEALHGAGLTALIGRDDELDVLTRRWFHAKAGQGQVVLLSGEAGIGKSHLTAAFLGQLASEPHVLLRYFCSPRYSESALHPIISQMEHAAGFARDDAPKVRLDKLGALLARSDTTPQDAALLADLLSIPGDGRYPAQNLAPPQKRQKTHEALSGQLARLAAQQPVVVIFEDIHWIDPTSLELLGRIVGAIKSARVLVLATCRPDFSPPWVGQAQVTSLVLNRLGERDVAAIITLVAGTNALPADMLAEIVERSDGIPMFVEEMTKSVLEADDAEEARKTVTAAPTKSRPIPASLQASLLARLDRLGPAKEVAQVGAAIGREFQHALLVEVAGKPEVELENALGRLIASGLLLRQGVPPYASYLFKHALVQDAAYGTLLRDTRRALHARIAEALKTHFAGETFGQPEILAQHYAGAGMFAEAIEHLLSAAQQATAACNTVEASAHINRALEHFDQIPLSDPRKQELHRRLVWGGWGWGR